MDASLHAVLDELNGIPGIRGSTLIGRDGFVIASRVMSGVEDQTISAMIGGISNEITQTISELRQGELQAVSLYASGGKLFFLCREELIMATVTEPTVNVGLVRVKMKTGLERMARLLANS